MFDPNRSSAELFPAKSTDIIDTLRLLAPHLRRFHLRFAAVVLLGLAATAAELATIGLILPLLETILGRTQNPLTANTPLSFVVDWLSPLSMEWRLRMLVLAIFALQAFRECVGFFNQRLIAKVGADLDAEMRNLVYERILTMDIRRVYDDTVAKLFATLNNFTLHAGQAVMSLLQLIPPTLLFAVYLGLLLRLSPYLTLLGAASMAVVFLAGSLIMARHRVWSERAGISAVSLTHRGFETLSAIRLLRMFSRESDSRRTFRKDVESYRSSLVAAAALNAAVSPINQLVGLAMLVVIVWVGTTQFSTDGQMFSELIGFYLIVLMRLAGPVATINSVRAQVAKAIVGARWLGEFLTSTDDPPIADGQHSIDALTGDIVFENVSFRYTPTEPLAINGATFTIERGKTTALVGPSGAGKSTALDLIYRLYDPTEGRIVVAGRDLREYKIADWRRRLASVSQDTYLFGGSLLENIRFGDPAASDERVFAAARAANVEEFIASLPMGYDTFLGDRGIRLSGGQAQRVSIARAILANPDVLILDEATSAQDAASERSVHEALSTLSRDRTVVIVAHRLSTVKNADRIIVLENGRVAESGTHVELLARDGLYARFVAMQDLSV